MYWSILITDQVIEELTARIRNGDGENVHITDNVNQDYLLC